MEQKGDLWFVAEVMGVLSLTRRINAGDRWNDLGRLQAKPGKTCGFLKVRFVHWDRGRMVRWLVDSRLEVATERQTTGDA